MALASNFGKGLLETFSTKDPLQSITKIQEFRDAMKDPAVGADYIAWITEPVNLTLVHKALAEDLLVPQKLLAIRRVPMSRTQKAVFMVQAIEMAIKKVHKL